LRKHRPAAGLNQEQFGLEADVQRKFISLIETRQNQPIITTIFKLAGALNLKPSKLIFETEKGLEQPSLAPYKPVLPDYDAEAEYGSDERCNG
jgi:transcriptional regulator with XRE-family HTH domain